MSVTGGQARITSERRGRLRPDPVASGDPRRIEIVVVPRRHRRVTRDVGRVAGRACAIALLTVVASPVVASAMAGTQGAQVHEPGARVLLDQRAPALVAHV